MTIPTKSEEITLGADCELRFEIESKECIIVEVSKSEKFHRISKYKLRFLTPDRDL